MTESTLRALELFANGMSAPDASRHEELERALAKATLREHTLLAVVGLLVTVLVALIIGFAVAPG